MSSAPAFEPLPPGWGVAWGKRPGNGARGHNQYVPPLSWEKDEAERNDWWPNSRSDASPFWFGVSFMQRLGFVQAWQILRCTEIYYFLKTPSHLYAPTNTHTHPQSANRRVGHTDRRRVEEGGRRLKVNFHTVTREELLDLEEKFEGSACNQARHSISVVLLSVSVDRFLYNIAHKQLWISFLVYHWKGFSFVLFFLPFFAVANSNKSQY